MYVTFILESCLEQGNPGVFEIDTITGAKTVAHYEYDRT